MIPALLRRLRTIVILPVLALSMYPPPCLAQLPYVKDNILVESGGSNQINVLSAHLLEQTTGTWGELKVQNVSPSPVNLMIYAEYLSGDGRQCFSMAFSSDRNIGEKGPIQPGETRQLTATNPSLSPAVRPASVRLHVVRLSPDQTQDTGLRSLVDAPATLVGVGSFSNARLQLAPDALRNATAPVEIAFAKVDIDSNGTIQNVSVLRSISPQIAEWFSTILHSLAIYPPLEQGIPTSGRLLVLAEAVPDRLLKGKAYLPRLSHAGEQVLREEPDSGPYVPVTTLLFRRPPTRIKRLNSTKTISVSPAPPGVVESFVPGSEWGTPGFTLTPDPKMPHGFRRIPALSAAN